MRASPRDPLLGVHAVMAVAVTSSVGSVAWPVSAKGESGLGDDLLADVAAHLGRSIALRRRRLPCRRRQRSAVSIQNEREWQVLCERFLRQPELATDPRFATGADRVAHREKLNAVVAARFAELDSETVMQLLEDNGIANGASVNSVSEFLDHPSLAGRGRWSEVDTPGGPVQALRPPADLAGLDPRMDPVPAAGQHTRSILAELGHDDAELDRLRADGVTE